MLSKDYLNRILKQRHPNLVGDVKVGQLRIAVIGNFNMTRGDLNEPDYSIRLKNIAYKRPIVGEILFVLEAKEDYEYIVLANDGAMYDVNVALDINTESLIE